MGRNVKALFLMIGGRLYVLGWRMSLSYNFLGVLAVRMWSYNVNLGKKHECR